jgi:hypothetical protein
MPYLKESENVAPLDYRSLMRKNSILTMNIVEKLSENEKPLVVALSNSTTTQSMSKMSKIAITNYSKFKELQAVFSSAACLNASFLNTDHYTTSNKYPGIDISKAKEVHDLIASFKDQYLNELVFDLLN